jgi:hypothetical protein
MLFFYATLVERVAMAMSQGELIWKRQQESKRFLSRQQTKDSSLQTYINQAKASKVIFTPTPGALAVQGSEARGPTDRGINANVYNPDGQVPTCCATIVNNDIRNVNQGSRVAMKNAGAVICCEPDYSLFNGYSVDLSGQFVKGGWAYPLANQPNTAKTTQAQQCASCLQFYFPTPAQPPLCTGCNTPYPSSSLYPPQPIDSELRRYGEAGVPRVGGTNSTTTNNIY